MTPEEAAKGARGGDIKPVYLIVGEERHLADDLVRTLRQLVMVGGVEGLNDDTLTAPQASVEEVLATARTLPMLARRRFLLVRGVEKWEETAAKGKGKTKDGKGRSKGADPLLHYLESPADSTVLVLLATKLDKRKKLYSSCHKQGYVVPCETPKRSELPGWIRQRAKQAGHPIDHDVADLIAELVGPELSTIADAVERLGLYVGEGCPIDEHAVSECVVRLRTQTVWELVGAVGRRDTAAALRALQDVYDPGDRGLRLLGVLAWATRQLLKFDQARKSGLDPAASAKAAGAPPFKARELEQQLRSLKASSLEQWLGSLAEADLALKGVSKRPPRATLEHMIIELCAFS